MNNILVMALYSLEPYWHEKHLPHVMNRVWFAAKFEIVWYKKEKGNKHPHLIPNKTASEAAPECSPIPPPLQFGKEHEAETELQRLCVYELIVQCFGRCNHKFWPTIPRIRTPMLHLSSSQKKNSQGGAACTWERQRDCGMYIIYKEEIKSDEMAV